MEQGEMNPCICNGRIYDNILIALNSGESHGNR